MEKFSKGIVFVATTYRKMGSDSWRGIGVQKRAHKNAVKKEGTIIGHLPRKLLQVCSLSLRRRGT